MLEAEQGGDGRAVGQMQPHVFAFAFQIDDFADSDERDLVVGFDREGLQPRDDAR